MKTFAEFQIIGRVGNVTPAGPTLKVSIAADYGRRNDKGEWEGKPYWNTVTLFNESIVKWAKDNLGQGDLVHARGTLRETSYDKDGETRYGVTLAADQFDRLVAKDRT